MRFGMPLPFPSWRFSTNARNQALGTLEVISVPAIKFSLWFVSTRSTFQFKHSFVFSFSLSFGVNLGDRLSNWRFISFYLLRNSALERPHGKSSISITIIFYFLWVNPSMPWLVLKDKTQELLGKGKRWRNRPQTSPMIGQERSRDWWMLRSSRSLSRFER